MAMKKLYKFYEVSNILGIHRNTINYWIRTGKVKEPPKDGHGWRVFTKEDIKNLKKYQKKIQGLTYF